MAFQVSFPSTPNGPFAIVHAEPGQMVDSAAAGRLRRDVSRLLGEIPIVVRCRRAGGIVLEGPEHLHRYAGSEADFLPVVLVDPVPGLRRVA
jgi:hypothetical protein